MRIAINFILFIKINYAIELSRRITFILYAVVLFYCVNYSRRILIFFLYILITIFDKIRIIFSVHNFSYHLLIFV